METAYPAPSLIGTTTNNNAPAGYVGEVISSILALAGALPVTTATPLNITSISLTAGDWRVSGVAAFVPAGTTSVTLAAGGISSVSATLPLVADGGLAQFVTAANVLVNPLIMPVSLLRVLLASTTTIFLVASATFTVSTMTAYGGLTARRMR